MLAPRKKVWSTPPEVCQEIITNLSQTPLALETEAVLPRESETEPPVEQEGIEKVIDFKDGMLSYTRYALDEDSVFLDVGCGKGDFLIQVAQTIGCRCIGIDIEATNCEIAKERIKGAKPFLKRRRRRKIEEREGNSLLDEYSSGIVACQEEQGKEAIRKGGEKGDGGHNENLNKGNDNTIVVDSDSASTEMNMVSRKDTETDHPHGHEMEMIPISSLVEIKQGNALEVEGLQSIYNKATIIFLYLVPRGLRLMKPLLDPKSSCLNVQKIITYMAPLPDTPISHQWTCSTPNHPGSAWPIYVYDRKDLELGLQAKTSK